MEHAKFSNYFVGVGLKLALVLVALIFLVHPVQAHAESMHDLQEKVEQTAADYNEAMARVEDLNQKIGENQKRIDEIAQLLPEAKRHSNSSARVLYLFHRENLLLLNVLLSSESLDEFLSIIEYFDRINSHNVSEIQKLKLLNDELQERQSQLELDAHEAKAEAERADAAMREARQARQEAEEEAIEKAKAEVKAAADLMAKEAQAKGSNDDSGVDAGNDEVEQPESDEVEEVSETVFSDSVDWSDDKQAFVAEWSGRIDAYLSGSPMAGQGETFASAAWDNGVDPRWSPAISCVESTKGTYCFLPCNAWGWGDYGFGSWEEAIVGHVAYLGSMYGSTITYEAATIYCPPNASFWYNRCLEEMNSI